jgi:NDP-sugar pyrophosphorylase family protein
MTLPAGIICGGMGTRLHPLTERIPKALIHVAGEPFIAHQLRLLKASGIERVVLCAGFHGDLLRDYVGDGARFGVAVDYSFDGPSLLGTAGALRKALPLLGEEFFALYGDSYLPCDYTAVARCFQDSGAQALMTVFCNGGRWDASNVELGEDGAIRAYDKKNRSERMRHIDYGLGVFRASAFDRVLPATFFDLAALYRQLLADGMLTAYEVKERFYEIGSLQGIEELNQLFIEKNRR